MYIQIHIAVLKKFNDSSYFSSTNPFLKNLSELVIFKEYLIQS